MLKRYTFWLWVTVVVQLLTAAVHSISLFITPAPTNDTERQLIDILMNTRLDMGAGIHRSPMNLFIALSSCFSFLYLLAALINIYLLRKKVDPGLVRGMVGIQLVVLGVYFCVAVMLTFLLPITFTGLVFVTLAITFFLTPKVSTE